MTTAVEWLVDELLSGKPLMPSLTKQAFEMEKQQKEYFFECGRQYQLTGEGTFTEVYNETFKKD